MIQDKAQVRRNETSRVVNDKLIDWIIHPANWNRCEKGAWIIPRITHIYEFIKPTIPPPLRPLAQAHSHCDPNFFHKFSSPLLIFLAFHTSHVCSSLMDLLKINFAKVESSRCGCSKSLNMCLMRLFCFEGAPSYQHMRSQCVCRIFMPCFHMWRWCFSFRWINTIAKTFWNDRDPK